MMPRDDDDKHDGVHRVFCLRVFFCRVYVQLRVENSAGSCKCTMCFNSPPHIYICYPVQYFLPRLFISVPRVRRICASEALFFKKGKGKREGESKERGTSGERQPLASKFHRPRATIVIHYLATLHASRVEINGVTFCNYTPSGSMPTSHSNRSGVPATRLKIYDFKVSVTLQII